MFKTNSDPKSKSTTLRCCLCNYIDTYLLVRGTTTITGAGDAAAARPADEREKGVVFENCAPFIK